MPKAQKSNLFTDIIFSKFFIVIGLILLALLLYGLVRSVASNYVVDNQIKDLENQISSLEGDSQKMTQFFNYLQTDDFVAREARMKLGLKKEGENLVVVKDQEVEKIKETAEAQAVAQQTEQKSFGNNFKKWFEYFLN